MNKSNQLKKHQLRRKVLAERPQFNDQFRRSASARVFEIFKTLHLLGKNKVVHSYLPIEGSGEIDTWGIVDWLERSGLEIWTTYLPADGSVDGFCKISVNTTYDIGRYGVPLPREEVEVNCRPDIVLVPCLALDKTGNRLGYGSGWYDKFLCEHKNAISIGLVYEQFLFDEVLHDKNDQQLDVVISEKQVIEFKRCIKNKL